MSEIFHENGICWKFYAGVFKSGEPDQDFQDCLDLHCEILNSEFVSFGRKKEKLS